MHGAAIGLRGLFNSRAIASTMYFGCLIPLRTPLHLPLKGFCVTIGRSAAACRIVLNVGSISRLHCVISREPDGIFLQDLGSLNGSWIDGMRVNRLRLRDGQILQLGREQFLIELAEGIHR